MPRERLAHLESPTEPDSSPPPSRPSSRTLASRRAISRLGACRRTPTRNGWCAQPTSPTSGSPASTPPCGLITEYERAAQDQIGPCKRDLKPHRPNARRAHNSPTHQLSVERAWASADARLCRAIAVVLSGNREMSRTGRAGRTPASDDLTAVRADWDGRVPHRKGRRQLDR